MLFQRFIYGNTYCAIEHSFVNDKRCFNVLVLTYKKKTLEIASSQSFGNLQEVIDKLPKQQHVFVIINTNKVLSKKIEGVHELTKAVSSAFPNIKSEDFAIEILPQQTHSFVSICRNQDVEDILDAYAKYKINVIGYSLGNNSVATLVPYSIDELIQTANSEINVKESIISSITKRKNIKNELYEINGLKINSASILPLSGILSYYANVNLTKVSYAKIITKLKDDYKQKRIFTNAIKIGLGFIFLVLIVNFLIFSNYRDQIIMLKGEQQVNEKYKEALVSLNQEVAKKRNLVVDISSTAVSKVSYYMDELASSLPNSILLSHIQYQPLQKSIKAGKEIEVAQHTILVSGNSNKSEDFSTWIADLENQDWVDNVFVLEYGIGKKSKTAFKLHLKLKS